jgi:hypothetical protein
MARRLTSNTVAQRPSSRPAHPFKTGCEVRIDRRAKSRGLHALERVGFVRVTRDRGRPALHGARPGAGGVSSLALGS